MASAEQRYSEHFLRPEAQTMPRPQLRELQNAKLQQLIDRVWNQPIPFFKRKMESVGLRPEHITEAHAHLAPGEVPFDANLEVTEPMGMETLVYFPLNGTQVCGRVDPNAGAQGGQPLRLAANLNNMHLIDEATGQVV